ncbi:hypothetical protein ACQ4PT_009274 [Festuca glaucescens]
MEEPTNPGGGGGHGGGEHGGWSGVSSAGVVHGDGGHRVDAGSGVEDLEELRPLRPSNAAAMLAQIWVDNPASSERFTFGLGGIDLDPEIWEVRIHLDGVDNLERRLARDDITVMNLYAMIETQGFTFSDSIYCRHVKRGRQKNPVVYDPVDANADEGIAGSQSASCIINYADPVVYDLTPPPVYAVDGEGTVFPSQSSYFATQESRNDAANGIPDLNEANNVDMDFDMGVADFNMMEEMRRKEQAEIAERIEEMRQERMDPLLHCEGDTDIEDLFVTEEVEAAAIPLDSVGPQPSEGDQAGPSAAQAPPPQAPAAQAPAPQAHAAQAPPPQAPAPRAAASQAPTPRPHAAQATTTRAPATRAPAPRPHAAQATATRAPAPRAPADQAPAPRASASQPSPSTTFVPRSQFIPPRPAAIDGQ